MQQRLEKLKSTLHLEWGELAEKLGVSRSMVDQVRKGVRAFGPKAERRLIELESISGLKPALPASGKPVSEGFQRLQKMEARRDAVRAAFAKFRLALDELEETLEKTLED